MGKDVPIQWFELGTFKIYFYKIVWKGVIIATLVRDGMSYDINIK